MPSNVRLRHCKFLERERNTCTRSIRHPDVLNRKTSFHFDTESASPRRAALFRTTREGDPAVENAPIYVVPSTSVGHQSGQGTGAVR